MTEHAPHAAARWQFIVWLAVTAVGCVWFLSSENAHLQTAQRVINDDQNRELSQIHVEIESIRRQVADCTRRNQ